MRIFFSFITFLILIIPQNVYAEDVILAGGCFWCMEHDFETIDGVNSVKSGYSGGMLEKPTYENHSGHQEVVLVDYDPMVIEFNDLLRTYFRNIDPLDLGGQFCDRGDSYRAVIFFKDAFEESQAKKAFTSASKELHVPIEDIRVDLEPRNKFWIAEDYHQDFATKNELKYKFYRFSCGRDKRLDQLWGDNARTDNPWL